MPQSESEMVDDLQDVQELPGDDSTDWQAEHKKLTEKVIRSRERNKTVRDELKQLKVDFETYRQAHPEAQSPDKKEPKTEETKVLAKLEQLALRQAGLEHPEDIELARQTAKKWGQDLDEVLIDDDFKLKLERQRTNRANVEATSEIKGSTGSSQAKNTPEYWIAKGVPPTPQQVPERKTRAKIARAMMESAKNSKKFYND